jgi:hypothetical protein
MITSPCIGQKVVVTGFSYGNRIIEPEAVGSLQVLEIRVLSGQPGARLRMAGLGQWKPLSTETQEVASSTANFALNRNDSG